ncbi:MAG: PspA-associated protein PspAA [Bacillota bacterium]
MIVRISTEGQYEMEGQALAELDRLDDNLLDAIELGDHQQFLSCFHDVLALIRGRGSKLPDTELVESDLILPQPETTLEEARELFAAYPRVLS